MMHEKRIVLDPRLSMIAEMVGRCDTYADIGQSARQERLCCEHDEPPDNFPLYYRFAKRPYALFFCRRLMMGGIDQTIGNGHIDRQRIMLVRGRIAHQFHIHVIH